MNVTKSSFIAAIRVAAPTASIAVTAVASAGLQIPAVSSRLKLTNMGPNKCFVSVSGAAAALAVPAGAAFAFGCIAVGVNEAMLIDLETVASGAYLSAVCAATETATLVATAW